MILTLEVIENALRPVHEAIAHTESKDLKSAGLSLHNFIHGAKFMSSNLAQELQLRINEQEQTVRPSMERTVLDAYQGALGNISDETMRFLHRIGEIAGSESPLVKERCDDAITEIALMTSARRNNVGLSQRDKGHRSEGPS